MKRGRAEDESESESECEDKSSSEDESASSSDEELEEASSQDSDTIDVDFEFFDPKEADFHGLKALLKNYLDGQDFAISELVDNIIKQSSVGTVLKTSDDGDPIGVLTVLSLARNQALTCVKDIGQYFLSNCKDAPTRTAFEEVWRTPKTVGLIISERLINCPPQLAPPLQQALFDEIDWATEDEPTKDLRDSFQLDNFILISRVFSDPADGLAKATQNSKKQAKKREGLPLIVYGRPEDEFYHKHSSYSYTFATGQPVSKGELQPLRLVLLISRQQIDRARHELEAVLGGPAE